LKFALAASSAALCLGLTGCTALQQAVTPVVVSGAKLHGTVHGGQQAISGAAIHLYAASTAGYGVSVPDLLNITVTTGSDGSFNFPSSAYSCTAGQQLWIVAIGGQPGGVAGTNANAANLAALGDCANVNDNTFVNINEVSTVGSVFAMAPFMTGYAAVGSSSTNTAGLARAFVSVNKLVNTATGVSTGSALPTGAVGPSSEINTLADAVSYCINSTGGVAGDGSACGNLFLWATPPAGSAPTNTIDAVMDIAHYPALNVANIYNSVHDGAPFSPRLSSAPGDWTMAVVYSPTGLSQPQSTTVDGSGNIWLANSGNSTVTVLSQTGSVATTMSGNGLSSPFAIAIDSSGNGWVANHAGSSVSAFTLSGSPVGSSPFTGSGNISQPSALAIDAAGQIWVGNTGTNSLTVLGSSGSFVRQVTSGVTAPTAIAIDPK
jgi:hypothetical protein